MRPTWAMLGHLSAILGPSWASLRPYWAILSSYSTLGALGVILAVTEPPCGLPWGHLELSWGHLGVILGPSGGRLGPSSGFPTRFEGPGRFLRDVSRGWGGPVGRENWGRNPPDGSGSA
jgi:hypothetical protein